MKTPKWKETQYPDGVFVRPCWICGKLRTKAEATVDHVHPRSLGGTNDPKNYRIACGKCNQKKGSKVLSRKSKQKRNWNAAQRGY